jgi:hypothetical protein
MPKPERIVVIERQFIAFDRQIGTRLQRAVRAARQFQMEIANSDIDHPGMWSDLIRQNAEKYEQALAMFGAPTENSEAGLLGDDE